jgi:hypothetical protein
MNESRVTPEGLQDARPGAEATTGANVPPGGGGPRRRRRRDEPEFRSYYELPILNKIVWATPDVAGYLFVGGLAGAGGVIGAAAHATGRPQLRRLAKVTAAGGSYLSLIMLVHDLGRPARFLNMLRMVKVTSPMNIGSWLLSGFGASSSLAALCDLTGRARRLDAVATGSSAVLGTAVATYTAALISDTAVPAWHAGYREMPFVFASSATASAAGWGLLFAPADETAPLAPLAAAAGALEVGLTTAMEQRTGIVKQTFDSGAAGRLGKAAKAVTSAGAALAVFARGNRLRSALAGGALVTGSLLTRLAIFKAGIASVEDPKYTVVPQRERAAAS